MNEFLGVANVSYLLSCLSFTLGAGSVTLYVHTLRKEQPSAAVVALLVAATAAVWLTLVLLWVAAPVHEEGFARFRDVPLSAAITAFEWIFHLVFIPVMTNVAICAFGLSRRTQQGDPARRVGLIMIGVGNSLDVVAHLLYLFRVSFQPLIGDPALAVATAADLITVVAVFGICAGTTALLAVPQLLHSLRALRLTKTLRPLWRRTLELYPEVALRGGWRTQSRATLQAERMLIEIADAMRLLPVFEPGSDETDPYALIAAAFRQPPTGAEGRLAAAATLPTPTSRLEEEQQMLTLAHHYNTGLSYAS